MIVEIRILARHGKPATCPEWREVAIELGSGPPSFVLLEELAEAVCEEYDSAARGNVCQIQIELRPIG